MEDHSSSRDHAPTTTDGQGNPALAVTKAFTDDKGNRFIFPSFIIWPDKEAQHTNPAKHDLTLRAMGLEVAISGLRADEGWFEFDPARFPHVRTDIGSRAFLHGGATVMLFAGPEFDALRDGASSRPPVTSDAVPGTNKETDQ